MVAPQPQDPAAGFPLVRAEARVLLAEEARAAAEAEALLALLKIGKDRVAGNEGGAG